MTVNEIQAFKEKGLLISGILYSNAWYKEKVQEIRRNEADIRFTIIDLTTDKANHNIYVGYDYGGDFKTYNLKEFLKYYEKDKEPRTAILTRGNKRFIYDRETGDWKDITRENN